MKLNKELKKVFSILCVLMNEFSGGTDHYSVVVISDAFDGLSSLKRHRMIMDLFKAEMETGKSSCLNY